jgi:hypothetical protein
LSGLTDSYHDGGGLIVVAESLEEAQKVNPAIGKTNPDKVFDLPKKYDKEAGYQCIFPDSGCC